VIRLHRDSFIVELPELPGFDRIEVAYHSSFRGTTERHDLGAENLDRARYRASGSTLRYEDLAFAESSEAAEAQGSAATVLWPEDFDDPDLIRIDGDPTEGDRRLNIVIVPDGYTYSNKALMEQHAAELTAIALTWAGGSGPLHPAADAPIPEVLLDAFPAPVDTTHELGRTDPFL